MFSHDSRCILHRNQLAEVICQFRFPEILIIGTTAPAEFQEKIRGCFPQFSVRKESNGPQIRNINGSFQIENSPVTTNYQFTTADNIWKVNLTSGFISLSCRRYTRWEEFAKHFGNDPEHVVFELLNEVTAKEFIDTWNKVSTECIKRIRKYAPDTLILVGSYYNNSACAVKDLAPRYDDKVIYNFHCYDPLKFTHQGATWTDAINPDERIAFDDADITPAFFDDFFASALEKAKLENSPLYCGEYGVIDRVSPEDTVKWYKAINEIFEKYGISRSAWSYKQMDFGLSDERLDDVREELLKYL